MSEIPKEALRKIESGHWSISRQELRELVRVYRAYTSAPDMLAGFMPDGGIRAGTDWEDPEHVRLHLSGFGDEREQAAIWVERVRVVVVENQPKGQ